MAALTARSDGARVLPSVIGTSPLFQDITPSHNDQAAPVGQIAPVLIGVLKATDGTPGVTVHLRPPELGQVNIRVDQTAGGAAHIGITVERLETLLLLQRDEPRLQQALDQAGILSTGRTISFQVAPDQVGATASRPDSMAPGSGGSGQGQSGGSWRQNNDAQRDFGQGPGPDHRQAHARWFRAGLDITA
jgi:flagellar hook-length control protein FliK